MSDSSRGPGHCPACGAAVSAGPSETYGNVPCPECGKRLWFCKQPEGTWFHDAEKVALVRERVLRLVAEGLGVDPSKVTDASAFVEDLGADSLDVVELVMSLEEEFEVKIPDAEAEKLKTVGQLIDWLMRHMPAGRSAG
jgi:acyl carrier protein